MRLVAGVLVACVAQIAPQYPSPMSDTTRPHPRVERYDVPGRRAALSTGTLYLSDRLAARARHPLVVHFHGAPWLIEHHVRERLPQAVLVTIQLGSGSRAYAEPFEAPARFAALLAEAGSRASEVAGRRIEFESITLSSFSAGYGGVRSILRHDDHYARIDALVLADSLHASYAGDATTPRTMDLPLDEAGLDVFIRFAADAAAGRKRMRLTHSEVYPGTYASTTETANVLLKHLDLARVRVLRDGPIGMQQVSEAQRGSFHVAGFAGNSAPDHMDHLYALGELLRDRRQEAEDRRQETGRRVSTEGSRTRIDLHSASCLPSPVPHTDSSRSKNER